MTKRGTLLGTQMAGLNEAINSYRLPNSNIGFNIPVEKLFHVNGTARGNFIPKNEVYLLKENKTADVVLLKAIEKLK